MRRSQLYRQLGLQRYCLFIAHNSRSKPKKKERNNTTLLYRNPNSAHHLMGVGGLRCRKPSESSAKCHKSSKMDVMIQGQSLLTTPRRMMVRKRFRKQDSIFPTLNSVQHCSQLTIRGGAPGCREFWVPSILDIDNSEHSGSVLRVWWV